MFSSFECCKPGDDICFSFQVMEIWKNLLFLNIFFKQEIYFAYGQYTGCPWINATLLKFYKHMKQSTYSYHILQISMNNAQVSYH